MAKCLKIVLMVLLCFSFVGVLSSCSEESQRKSDSRILDLVHEADRLEDAISKKNLLASSTPRDKSGIQGLLVRIRTALMALDKNPKDVSAFQNLRISLKELEGFQLLSEDRPSFQDFLQKTYSVAYAFADRAGIILEDFGWLQFGYNFSSGLAPFYSYPDNSWETNWALDDSFAKISGRSGDAAWLISPSFDLTQIENPQVRINHLFLVNKNSSESNFDRKLILETVFTAYVSTKYQPGENPNPLGKAALPTDKDNPWDWKKLDLGPLPNSYEFASKDTPFIDLSEYRGKKVTVAFYFNMVPSLGFHYPTWQIDRFELIGSQTGGNLVSFELPPEPVPPLARAEFEARSIEPFVTYATNKEIEWVPFSMGDDHWAKVDTGGRPAGQTGESWLFSPIYKIRDQKNVTLDIFEIVNTPIWANFKILISSNYKGGDPEASDWVEVPHQPERDVNPNNWAKIQIPSYDMSAFANKDIVVAFKFIDDGSPTFRGWEVEWLEFTGEGEPFEVEALGQYSAMGVQQ